LAALSIGYVYLVFLPMRQSIFKLREELSQKEAYLAQEPVLKASLDSATSDLEQTQLFVQDWRSKSPVAGELSRTYGEIHRCVKGAGMEIETFDPQNVTMLESVRQIPVRMTTQGTFGQMHAMLRALEQLPAKPWVESVRIERGKDAEAPLKGEATLVIFADNPENSDYVKPADNR
jgi:Tfp pilus assembly protein PilO